MATLEGPPSLLMIDAAGSMRRQGSDTRYNVKSRCFEIANGQGERFPLRTGMLSEMLSEWVGEAIASANTTQAEMSRRLTESLGREFERAAVNKMVKGTRAIAADEFLEIARITGHPLPKIDGVNSGYPHSEPGALDTYPLGSSGIPEVLEKHLVSFGAFVLKLARDGELQLDKLPKDNDVRALAEKQLEFFVSHLGAQVLVGSMERYRTRTQVQDHTTEK